MRHRDGALAAVVTALLLCLLPVLVALVLLNRNSVGSGRGGVGTPPFAPTAELLRGARSGSLLLSRHVTPETRRATLFNRVTRHGDWYHVGLLLRDPATDELCVLDCMADGDTTRLPCRGHRPAGEGGPRLTSALQYMVLYSQNPGLCAVRQVRGVGPALERAMWAEARALTRCGFINTAEIVPRLFRGLFERYTRVDCSDITDGALRANGVFCSEAVAVLLTRAGVLRPGIGVNAFTPWAFARAHEFDRFVLPPHSYGPVVCPDVFRCCVPSG